MSRNAIPRGPLLLGWAGVIPFALLALSTVAEWKLPIAPAPALVGYGAAILSFMGGVQWGLTMSPRSDRAQGSGAYAISVVPALIGWAGVLLPSRSGLVVLAAGFAALLAYDLWTVRAGTAPAWYGTLRLQLTTAVILLLLVAAAGVRP